MCWIELDDRHLLRADRVVVVTQVHLAAGRRLLATVKETRYCVELTAGKRRRSLLLLDSGHVVVSSVSPEEIKRRLAVATGGQGGEA